MTAVNDVLNSEPPAPATVEDNGVKRDQWGRYLIPDPDTGTVRGRTRVSTISRGLADTTSLEKWMQRNLVYGLSRREDLYAKAASVASMDEKQMLSTIIEEAFEAAASSTGANLGTALHRFTERVDDGEIFDVPSRWRADVNAYVATMKAANIKVLDHFTERVLLNTAIDAGGTCDRVLMRDDWALPRIGDLKTGRHVTSKMDEIAGQLAIYANASHWYDPLTGEIHEMPDVDRETAIVMHVPVGGGTCTLYEVNIADGWEAVQHEVAIRAWRKRKDLCRPFSAFETPAVESEAEPAPKKKRTTKAKAKKSEPILDDAKTCVDGVAQTEEEAVQKVVEAFGPSIAVADMIDLRMQWIRARIEFVIGHQYGKALAQEWNITCPEVPTFRNGGPATHAQIDLIAKACSLVEKANALPFFDGDPATPPTKTNNIIDITKGNS